MKNIVIGNLLDIFDGGGDFNMLNVIDNLLLLAVPKKSFEWPFDNRGGIHAETVLARYGVRCYRRRWPSAFQKNKPGATYGLSVSAKQFEYAYYLLLSHGTPIVSPPPPTPYLARLAADRELAMTKKPRWSWGKPVRNRGIAGFFTNMWRGNIMRGIPTKEQYFAGVKKNARKRILSWLKF